MGITDGRNLALGSGKVYFAKLLDDGTYDGYRYIQDTEEFSATVETETLEKMSADERRRREEESVILSEEHTGSLQSHDTRIDNLALYFQGDVDEVEQDADAVVDEEIDIKNVDRSYRVGLSEHPRGFRNISDFSLTEDEETDPTIYEEGVDYELDERRGIFYVLPDGAIEADSTVLASYDHPEVSYKQSTSGGVDEIKGKLAFQSNNNQGEDFDYEWPNARIRPGADVDLKSLNQNEWQSLELEIRMLQDEHGNTLYIEGEPYEPGE